MKTFILKFQPVAQLGKKNGKIGLCSRKRWSCLAWFWSAGRTWAERSPPRDLCFSAEIQSENGTGSVLSRYEPYKRLSIWNYSWKSFSKRLHFEWSGKKSWLDSTELQFHWKSIRRWNRHCYRKYKTYDWIGVASQIKLSAKTNRKNVSFSSTLLR